MNTRLLLLTTLFILFLTSCSESENSHTENATVTVTSFGGAYQEAQRDAYFMPFAQAHGIHISESEYNGNYGLLKQRATATNAIWDIVSVESGPALRAEQEGILAAIPKNVYSGLNLSPGAARTYAAGHLQFATVPAFRLGSTPNTEITWTDFWDLEKYPGKRGLRNTPRGTIEIALLADGVAPQNLYPLDVDRGLRKLEEIRDHILFWESGAQPIQYLANGVVTMTSAYNGRVWDASVKEGLPIGWSMDNGLYETEYWVVPRNSEHKDKAFAFIEFSLQTPQQVRFSNNIAYVPTNKDALPLVKAEVKPALPRDDDSRTINVDAEWWAANEEAVAIKWQKWKQGG